MHTPPPLQLISRADPDLALDIETLAQTDPDWRKLVVALHLRGRVSYAQDRPASLHLDNTNIIMKKIIRPSSEMDTTIRAAVGPHFSITQDTHLDRWLQDHPFQGQMPLTGAPFTMRYKVRDEFYLRTCDIAEQLRSRPDLLDELWNFVVPDDKLTPLVARAIGEHPRYIQEIHTPMPDDVKDWLLENEQTPLNQPALPTGCVEKRTTEATMDNEPGEMTVYYDDEGRPHHPTGPAKIFIGRNKTLHYAWYQHGVKTRVDGPALVTYNKDAQIVAYEYRNETGKLHRDHGPARLSHNARQWFIDGVQIASQNAPKIIEPGWDIDQDGTPIERKAS